MKNLSLYLICALLFQLSCSNSTTSESTPKATATTEQQPKVNTESNQVRSITSPISIDTSISLDYIMGKFVPETHPDFVQVPPKHANGRQDRYLHKDTYAAFVKMYEAAKKEGIELKILSATRNFAAQKTIWEGKWTGKRLHESKENLAQTTPNPKERALKILKWSSMPSTSRHHWGTDIDLNAFENDFFEKGEGLKIYNWLVANGPNYGFCQPYSPKDENRPNGYNEEKWHWSFLPIAQKLTTQAKLRLNDDLIEGFLGAETAKEIGVVQKYILGINEACL